MWFTKKIPKDQIDSRLFEFKGAVQTCNLGIIKFSLKVLTEDFKNLTEGSNFYLEILEFNADLTAGGSRRRILYNSFENLLNSVKLKKDIKLNVIDKMPYGFSCPHGTDINRNDFHNFWSNASSLKLNLTKSEVELRVHNFSVFIHSDNYSDDELNNIKWHNSDLTSDIVSGSIFARDTIRISQWENFSDSISSFGRLTTEQKNKAVEKFKEMLIVLPYNNFSKK